MSLTTLRRQVGKLEATRPVQEFPRIVFVQQSLDDIRQGKDLLTSAVEQGLLQGFPEDWNGALLPYPCQTIEEWYGVRDAMQEYELSLPVCEKHQMRLWHKVCYSCKHEARHAAHRPQDA
jgi:hypothetical protein